MNSDVKTEILESIERFKEKTWIEKDLHTLCAAAAKSINLSEQLDEIKKSKQVEEFRKAISGLLDETIVTRRGDNNELRCVACGCNVSSGEKHCSICPIEVALKTFLKK